ncbi:SRPBCC family protein [Pseudooceanicola sp.]|uniref:SRPBCC family protein n=1 Tax=Pseudooceanicola sp. TaxID=1914328 RepID=UPI002624ACEC|nr:SRPBCC family protein [Pseudooceanicola sp.]MDF1855104.1 SRPBCC family protein [Pseudooceanicola sp.]
MKFVAKEDIEAPIEFVFDDVSDFESFQRSAMRRGAEITRTDSLSEVGVGMSWDVAFDLRGRRREMAVKLVEFEKPTEMRFEAESPSLNVDCWIELIALSRKRTRIKLHLELKPQNLSARLLVQSLKLAKTNLTKRLQLKVADYASLVQDKSKRHA